MQALSCAAAACACGAAPPSSRLSRVAPPPRSHARRRARTLAAAASGDAPPLLELPSSTERQVALARAAAQAAFDAGVTRQRLLLLLPLIGATDLDDWPGGTRQQWTAAKPMVSAIVSELQRASGAPAAIVQKVLDDGDAVVQLSTPRHTAVVFPTADTLGEVRARVRGSGEAASARHAAARCGRADSHALPASVVAHTRCSALAPARIAAPRAARRPAAHHTDPLTPRSRLAAARTRPHAPRS
jgi:hypothetical protein